MSAEEGRREKSNGQELPQPKPIVEIAFQVGWTEDGEFTCMSAVPAHVLVSMLEKVKATTMPAVSFKRAPAPKIVPASILPDITDPRARGRMN